MRVSGHMQYPKLGQAAVQVGPFDGRQSARTRVRAPIEIKLREQTTPSSKNRNRLVRHGRISSRSRRGLAAKSVLRACVGSLTHEVRTSQARLVVQASRGGIASNRVRANKGRTRLAPGPSSGSVVVVVVWCRSPSKHTQHIRRSEPDGKNAVLPS